jgi:hypothetical protein
MTAEHEIGRVVAVDTAQVTVELNRELKALTRSTYEGAIEVGRINSYIIIPVGSRRIVAMVTRVVIRLPRRVGGGSAGTTLAGEGCSVAHGGRPRVAPSTRRARAGPVANTIRHG